MMKQGILLILCIILLLNKAYSFHNKSSIQYDKGIEIAEWSSTVVLAGFGTYFSFSKPKWFSEPNLSSPRTDLPIAEESFPDWGFYIAGPLLLSGILFLPNNDGWLNDTTYINTKGFIEAWSLTLFTTQMIKQSVGRKRPDYNQRVVKNYNIADGFYSFWSGHAASSFCIATYSSLYILEHLGVWNDSFHATIKIVSSLLLLAGASWISYTRVENNRHFQSDVLVGGIVGSLTAMIIYAIQNEWFFKRYTHHSLNSDKAFHISILPNNATLTYEF